MSLKSSLCLNLWFQFTVKKETLLKSEIYVCVIMSINDSVQSQTYGVTINVPEKLIEELLSNGKKPTFILSRIFQRMASEMKIEEIIDYAEARNSSIVMIESIEKEKPSMQKSSLITHEWTYQLFEDYINKLLKQAERRADVADLVSMLIAYIDTSSRPTSEELREARNFGLSDNWYEELRTSKARLTIAAKHMGLPSFFPRAYGSGLNRRHPIDENIYKFLYQWSLENKNVVENYRRVATPRSTG